MDTSSDILLFTDNQEIHSMFESILDRGDLFLHFARKDESGLTKITNHEYDLVIFEISQPLFSEITYIENIHSLASHVPIVILSEYFGETKNTIFGNKIAEFVSKPFTMEHMLKSINSVLKPDTLKSPLKTTGTEELEKRKLSVLYEMSKSLNSITDFNLLLKTIINLSTDALEAERATIFVYDRAKNELWSRVGTGLRMEEIRFPATKGIAGEVVTKGNSIITDNPYNHPAFNKEFDVKSGFKTRNLLCVPMKNLNGILVGAFQVLNKNEGIFSKEDELFLSAIAASTAIAIENTLLHEENNLRYNELIRLYDDLYTTQNQIVNETKHSTISELRGFITELRKHDSLIQILSELEEINEIKSDVAEKISSAHRKMFSQFGAYMNKTITDIEEKTK